jgi:glutathione S-transferase
MSNTDSNNAQRMRMYWSARSPFARYVMLAAHEIGIADQIETIPTHVTGAEPVPEIEPYNPVGRIPVMVLPNGQVIHDSRVIVEYLDTAYGGNKLLPQDLERRIDALTRASIGQAMIERGVRWIGDRFRPKEQQNPKMQAFVAHTLRTSLDHLEKTAPEWADLPFDIGHLAIGNILSYLDFRFDELAWREGRPQLAKWFEPISQRPSFVATAPQDTSGLTITKVDS